MKEKYNNYARQFLTQQHSHPMGYVYNILTTPLAELSPQKCLFWTIDTIKEPLKRLEQDALALRSITELEQIKLNCTIDKAIIFDELSFKNWHNRILLEGVVSVHLVLARMSWACLSFLCLENKQAFTSNCRTGNSVIKEDIPFLYKNIGWECGAALSILFGQKEAAAKACAQSYTTLMNLSEKT